MTTADTPDVSVVPPEHHDGSNTLLTVFGALRATSAWRRADLMVKLVPTPPRTRNRIDPAGR